MLAGLEMPPAIEAERVVTVMLADLRSVRHRGGVVDSLPGAGKSTWVVRAAIGLATAGRPVIIMAKTNEQVDDVIDRLAKEARELHIRLLSPADCQPSERVKGHEGGRVAANVADLGGPAVIIGTAADWARVTEDLWPWAVDEAYQLRSDSLLHVAGRCELALFVSDSGQLDPFSGPSAETLNYIFNTSNCSGEGG